LATPADLVRDNCGRLPGYIGGLFAETLLAAYGSPDGAPVRLSPSAVAPMPGDAAAFYALTTIWEAIPRIEARLRYELNGHPGQRRGGSGGNLLDALAAIPKLAAGLDEDAEAWAARMLEWLNDLAREHPGIDEAQRWRHVRGRACPYCKLWSTVKVLLDRAGQPTGYVECRSAASVRCADANGRRPSAHISTDDHGRVVLAWADGLVEAAPDLEEAG
jgi:hypothetical protein